MAAMRDHLSDADIWATVKFIKEGVVDLTSYVDLTTAKPKNGNSEAGHIKYQADCTRCHGSDGRAIDFCAGVSPPEYVGTVATEDVFLQHRIRFSRVGKVTPAGESMPAFAELGYTMNDVMDVIAYCQTLPTE